MAKPMRHEKYIALGGEKFAELRFRSRFPLAAMIIKERREGTVSFGLIKKPVQDYFAAGKLYLLGFRRRGDPAS
jgi:hypothetical protein